MGKGTMHKDAPSNFREKWKC